MAVRWTRREPSLGRHVRRELMRNALLGFTPIILATACYQRKSGLDHRVGHVGEMTDRGHEGIDPVKG
jgi:hypothetical protein